MKLHIRWYDGSMMLEARSDDHCLIDRFTIPEGMEVELTLHEDPEETALCVGIDRALGTEERQERQRAETD